MAVLSAKEIPKEIGCPATTEPRSLVTCEEGMGVGGNDSRGQGSLALPNILLSPLSSEG